MFNWTLLLLDFSTFLTDIEQQPRSIGPQPNDTDEQPNDTEMALVDLHTQVFPLLLSCSSPVLENWSSYSANPLIFYHIPTGEYISRRRYKPRYQLLKNCCVEELFLLCKSLLLAVTLHFNNKTNFNLSEKLGITNQESRNYSYNTLEPKRSSTF